MQRLKILLRSNLFYIVLIIVLIIYIVIFTVIIRYNSRYNEETINVTGMVSNLKEGKDTNSFILKSDENVMVYSNKELSIKEGQVVNVTGRISAPTNNTIPNTFNYKKYLYNNRIYVILSAANITVIKDPNFLHKIKNWIYTRLDSNNNSSTYLKLFIMGSKDDLSNTQYSIYRENGIAHLLAVSGMHVSFLIAALNIILSRFSNKVKNIIIVSFLLFYLFLTSFSVSISRCFIFYILQEINKKKRFEVSNIKLLIIAAAMLLLINPFYIYNTGFLYSHVITLGLFLNQDYIRGNYIKKVFIISIISMIYSFPITVNLNYEINIFSIIVNVMLVPFVSFCLFPLSFLVLIFPFLNNIYGFLIGIFELLNLLLNKCALNFTVPKLSLIIIVLYYLGVVLWSKTRNNRVIFLIILMLALNKVSYYLINTVRVFFLDVGQGDSLLVVSENNRDVILVDTGGKMNNEGRISNNISLFLKSNNISKINYLVLTHGDFDHMGEAINLVNNFKVEKVIFNCGLYNDLEKDLIKALDKKKIPYYSCIKELNIDKNKLYFLQTKEYDNENDNSNVIYTEINGYKFMFMGDASTTTEKELLNKYNLPDIDVLKVGHHGSKTSSSKEFINDLNPKYSIISVGKNNRYGHPNKEALENLKDSKIYRTDQDGSIMFKLKNNKLEIKTCRP